jgi:hypothetical protein
MPTLKRKLFAANLGINGEPVVWDLSYIDNTKFQRKFAYTTVTSGKH